MAISKAIMEIVPVLQNGYKLETNRLVKDGYIQKMLNEKEEIVVSPAVVSFIGGFDGVKCFSELLSHNQGRKLDYVDVKCIIELVNNHVIQDKRPTSQSVKKDNMRTCTKCVNNDYVIPDLSFDESGVCSICQIYDKALDNMLLTKRVPFTENDLLWFANKEKSRFDVMVLFTGGKDSSFILWYLAKKMNLRVLAATWNMPFMNEASLSNIKNAVMKLPNVEFIQRTVRKDEMKAAIINRLKTNGIPCLCPVVAYLLFYPVAIQENIPLIIDGTEDIQSIILDSAFSKKGEKKTLNDRDQTVLELVIMLRGLKRQIRPNNQISFLSEADKIIKYISDKSNSIPIIKHLANLEFCKEYSWDRIVKIIQDELSWVMPEEKDTHLHTSCKIEKMKDYCQYKLYKNMRLPGIPQSIKEISAAVYMGHISREEGLKELNGCGYFEKPSCIEELCNFLEMDEETLRNEGGELSYILRD